MDTLMSLPMTASVLTEYGDLEEACRSCGCDGLEVVWGGEDCLARCRRRCTWATT